MRNSSNSFEKELFRLLIIGKKERFIHLNDFCDELEKKGVKTEEISPRKFAKTAKQLDKGFKETLQILARELSGGQV